MTSAKQRELDAIMHSIAVDYGKLTRKQQAFAVREIGRIKGDVAYLLSDYTGSDGLIRRNRINALLRDLDAIEAQVRKNGIITMSDIIKESAEWTTIRANDAVKTVTGVAVGASVVNDINEEVVKYTVKRFTGNGLVLSDRIWATTGEIRDDMAKVIRTSIIRGEGVNTMIPKIRRVYDNDTWMIKRLARNESVTAYRAAVSYNAQASNVVDWLQFHAGVKRSKPCVALAEENRYGEGKGVFKPTDEDIWMPHVNCTSYATYILKDEYL